MKVSLKTVKYYTGGELNLDNVDELVQKIGAQLGAVEEVVDYGKRYENIVVAKVVKCQKHPDADKLSVCEIDAGTGQNIQVVCGAPNAREGLVVAWIPPGATVPATYDKDPFVLEAREIRGVLSNGMLASPSELAISDDHNGILEIESAVVGEQNIVPGTPFKNLYGLDDTVIDIENKMFTHRPDCFGVLGVAREIAGIYDHKFESPDWYLKIPKIFLKSSVAESIDNLNLEVKIEIPELVPRFMAVAMSDIEVKPSPIWVQALLTRIGVKPINNVVDITNHLAYITGQPLHAYDYDKVKNLSSDVATLVTRHPNPGEQIKLLNGKTIEPRPEAIMISTDQKLIGVGGVMGGSDTEVDENTKNIIIECANFDMYSVRRTSMHHGLFTDAVSRNNKGQSPLQNDRVIAQMMELVTQIADGKQASDVIDLRNISEDIYLNQSVNKTIVASAKFINSRLGLELSNDEISRLFRNVEFACLEEKESGEIEFHAPFWRTDIQIKEDIVEEVGRLLGYDKLPNILPRKPVTPSLIDNKIKAKTAIRTKLASLGANEVLTYSFVHGDLLKKAQQNQELAFKLNNAISPDLQYYRLSLTPNLLANVHANIKTNYNNFALFEIGSVHSKSEIGEDKVPAEFGRVALVVADKKSTKAAFYNARAYVENLGIKGLKFSKIDQQMLAQHKLLEQMFAPYDPERSAFISTADGHPVGVVGEFRASVAKALKLPEHCAGFEIFLSVFKDNQSNYVPLSRYPSVSQDVCLEVDKKLEFSELEDVLNSVFSSLSLEDINIKQSLVDIYTDEDLGAKKRITFRLETSSYARTLDEQAVNGFVKLFTDQLSEKLNVTRI